MLHLRLALLKKTTNLFLTSYLCSYLRTSNLLPYCTRKHPIIKNLKSVAHALHWAAHLLQSCFVWHESKWKERGWGLHKWNAFLILNQWLLKTVGREIWSFDFEGHPHFGSFTATTASLLPNTSCTLGCRSDRSWPEWYFGVKATIPPTFAFLH